MTKRGSWLVGIILAGLAIGVSPAQAGPNLVTNGSFESGDFTGWTPTGNTDFNGVFCPGAPEPADGDCFAYFGPLGTTGGIEQVIDVGGPGLPWHLSFYLDTDGGVPSSFLATFGGVTLLVLDNPLDAPWTQYHFSGVTTGALETLAFSFRDDPGFLLLDGVVLAFPESIPEPATLGLLGAGLAGLFFSRRRKAA